MTSNVLDFLFLTITAGVFVVGILIYARKMASSKKLRTEAVTKIEDNKNYYQDLTVEKIENAPDGNHTHVILYYLMAKEDEYFAIDEPEMSFHDYLTKPERKIYGIYLLERELTHKGSIEQFMTASDGSMYVKELEELFTDIKQYELKECFSEAIEYYRYSVGETDEENSDGSYSSYNLTDFKEEIISFIRQESFLSAVDEYVITNASLFIKE